MRSFIWFWYWVFTGRPHPDHVAEVARQWREWETEAGRQIKRAHDARQEAINQIVGDK